MSSNGLDVLDPLTRRHVENAAEALQEEFSGIFSRETIARYIAESADQLGQSKITVFVPILVERFARERLVALAQSQHLVSTDQPEVLFVCVHNAGRAQMAAGLLQLRSNGRIHVRSAGSAPGEEINPAVIEAMGEIGVDMSQEFPKPLTDEFVAGRRRRDHDGLRRCLPDLSRQALRGLGSRRSRRAGRRGGARDPRRDRPARSAADGRASSGRRVRTEHLRPLLAEADRHVRARLRRLRRDHGRPEDRPTRPRRRRDHVRARDHVRDLRRRPHLRRALQSERHLRLCAEPSLPVESRRRLLGSAARRSTHRCGALTRLRSATERTSGATLPSGSQAQSFLWELCSPSSSCS